MIDQIAIGIPTYRGAERLERTLRTARAFFPFRIVVADDGTESGDPPEAERIAAAVERYGAVGIPSRENRGVFAALSRLLAAAERPYMLLLDDDVLYTPGLAERALTLFERVPNAGMLSWVTRHVTPAAAILAASADRKFYRPIPRTREPEIDTELAGSCSAFRIETFQKVGFFDDRFRCYYGDSDAAVALTKIGHPCFRVWGPDVPHLEHGTTPLYSELQYESGRDADMKYFVAKWGAPPVTMRDRMVGAIGESMRKSLVASMRD